MAIVVEHDKRKAEILTKSLDLFVEEGYEDVTFQKIADRCGITRTTLYIYFKNKREIFQWSIKQLTNALETAVHGIMEDTSLSSRDCLIQVANKVVDVCEENARLFYILQPYFYQLSKSGVDISERIARRVIRMRHIFSTIIINGIEKGEFKDMSVKDINNLLQSLIESVIFRLSYSSFKNADEVRTSIVIAVDGICR